MTIRLSVLIASVPERLEELARMVGELKRQSEGRTVEILVLLENRKRTIGAKRNALVEMAKGDYVVFVDDDDMVESNFVQALCDAIDGAPGTDCIVFDEGFYERGIFRKIVKHGIEYEHGEDDTYIYRKPNTRSCFAKRIAVRHKFLDISFGEDDEWASRAIQDIRHQTRIDAVLYQYRWIPKAPEWYWRAPDEA
jgi:glycosyltransferase involved in cell wall biosynthesis